MNKKCGIKMGAMLFITAFSVKNAQAQTCVVPPSCEDLGYTQTISDCSETATLLKCPLDQKKVLCVEKLAFNGSDPCAQMGFNKTEGDCSGKESLHCPYDESKVFCPAATGPTGSKIAEIGDIVYTDAISAEPISGRVPVGIVYDVSGKMMSISQFLGFTTTNAAQEKCNSYTTDEISDWSLSNVDDLGMIKTHVQKINETISKLSDAPRICTDCQRDYNNGSEIMADYGANYYWTTGDLFCMASNNEGCSSHDNTYKTGHKVRCVRTFGPNGANDIAQTPTEPVQTYAVGDAYKDADGNIIGTVVEVDTSGQHGTIANVGGSGTANDAAVACAQKTDGGKSWSLASGSNACTLLKTAGSIENDKCDTGNDMTCGIHGSNGEGVCYNNGKWCTKSNLYNNNTLCEKTDSLNYVCQTSF